MAGTQFFIDKGCGRAVIISVNNGPLGPMPAGNTFLKDFFIDKMIVASVDLSGTGFSRRKGHIEYLP